MRPIPPKLRAELARDPFMKMCVWTGETVNVSFEHCFTYSGRQINEKWAIVPLRRDLNVNMRNEVKQYCRYRALQRATEEDLAKYPLINWKQEQLFLSSLYDDCYIKNRHLFRGSCGCAGVNTSKQTSS